MSLVILMFWLTPRLEEVRMCVTLKIANQILNCINEGQVQYPKLEDQFGSFHVVWVPLLKIICLKQFRGGKA